MTGEVRPGLYRLFLKTKIRFFRIRRNGEGTWILHEYKQGDLHKELPEKKLGIPKTLWVKLQRWQ